MIGAFEQIALALMVFVIMLGMGATIRVHQLRTALAQPKALLVGLVCQFGLMPLIAFCLALALDLPAAVALSLIIVGATPGGTTSNLFTYYAKGDVALSVSMTVSSTLAAVVLMPIAISLYGATYISADLQIPVSNIVVTLVLVMVPVTIGAFILRRSESWAQRLEKISSIVGCVLIGALIAKFLFENFQMFLSTEMSLILAAILLTPCGFLLGYVLARIMGMPEQKSRTVSLETGIQNTPLSIAVITLSFSAGSQQDQMLLLPTFYAFFLVLSSALVVFGFRKLSSD